VNVTDLERGERFWAAVTGLPVRFSAVGYLTRYSRLGDIASQSILLQLVPEDDPPPTNNAHLDLTVEDVDVAVQQALALGATLFREKGTYPLGSPSPYGIGPHEGPLRKRLLPYQRSGVVCSS